MNEKDLSTPGWLRVSSPNPNKTVVRYLVNHVRIYPNLLNEKLGFNDLINGMYSNEELSDAVREFRLHNNIFDDGTDAGADTGTICYPKVALSVNVLFAKDADILRVVFSRGFISGQINLKLAFSSRQIEEKHRLKFAANSYSPGDEYVEIGKALRQIGEMYMWGTKRAVFADKSSLPTSSPEFTVKCEGEREFSLTAPICYTCEEEYMSKFRLSRTKPKKKQHQ